MNMAREGGDEMSPAKGQKLGLLTATGESTSFQGFKIPGSEREIVYLRGPTFCFYWKGTARCEHGAFYIAVIPQWQNYLLAL